MKTTVSKNNPFAIRPFLIICITSFLSVINVQAKAGDSIAIIPKPLSMQVHDGRFILTNSTTVTTTSPGTDVNQSIQWFISKISTSTGYHLSTKKSTGNVINLLLNKQVDTSLHDEGYTLKVTPSAVTITANKPAGLFYGLQTVLQLLPPSIESVSAAQNASWTMPCVDIKDAPRFGWRGLMLDVSRHFFTKPEVEEYINQMARYKYNTLHLHLADDEGWA